VTALHGDAHRTLLCMLTLIYDFLQNLQISLPEVTTSQLLICRLKRSKVCRPQNSCKPKDSEMLRIKPSNAAGLRQGPK